MAIIETIAGVVMMIIGLIILLPMILNKRSASKASLTADIYILQNGESKVVFIPEINIYEMQLMKMALLYAAKIGHALGNDSPEIIQLYKDMIGSIVTPSKIDPLERDFIEKILDLIEKVKIQYKDADPSKKGEIFTVHFIEGKSRDYITSTLPFNGIYANLPFSVICLIQAVVTRLSTENIKIFERALLHLGSIMFAPDTPLSAIKLNEVALSSLELGSLFNPDNISFKYAKERQ